MFITKGGTTKTTNSKATRPYYTGIVDAEIVRFNPTRDELIEIKGLNEKEQEWLKEPVYERPYGGRFISALCKANIRQAMKDKALAVATTEEEVDALKDEDFEKYPEEYFFNLEIDVSTEFRTNMNGDKVQVISVLLDTSWSPDTTVEGFIERVQNNPKLKWILEDWKYLDKNGELEEAPREYRIAKVGEVPFMNLLYNMHFKVGTREFPMSFTFGETTEEHQAVFDNFVEGDVSQLNAFIESDVCKNKKGEKVKVAMLLCVEVSDNVDQNGNPYLRQKVGINSNGKSFNKEGRQLPNDMIEYVKSDYFKFDIQGSYEVNEYDPKKAKANVMDMSKGSADMTALDIDNDYEEDDEIGADLPF